MYLEEIADQSTTIAGSIRYSFTTESASLVERILQGNMPCKTQRGHFDLGMSKTERKEAWIKNGAAQKLIAIFGHMDFIGLLHSILVETSKYIIIILFAIYTWHCFSVFVGNNTEKKKTKSIVDRIRSCIQFILSVQQYFFLNSLDVTILGLYLAQLALLIFVNKAYIYVYEKMHQKWF